MDDDVGIYGTINKSKKRNWNFLNRFVIYAQIYRVHLLWLKIMGNLNDNFTDKPNNDKENM